MSGTAWVVVPAAGQGRRFGAALPKQYLEVAGRSVLAHTLAGLVAHPRIAGVVLAVAAGDTRWRAALPVGAGAVRVVTGGAERADSVRAALDDLAGHLPPTARVLVHDAVRPCVHGDDIERLVSECWDEPAGGLLAVPVTDTLKEGADGRVLRTVPRAGLWRALTPQMAPLGVLRAALAGAGASAGDEAGALEASGLAPRLVVGRSDNIKITHAADLALAAAILEGRA